jgi:hypothetical protein
MSSEIHKGMATISISGSCNVARNTQRDGNHFNFLLLQCRQIYTKGWKPFKFLALANSPEIHKGMATISISGSCKEDLHLIWATQAKYG